MAALLTLAGFLGQNTKHDPLMLPDGTGVLSLNQKPGESNLRPWRDPIALVGPVVPAFRQTLYRMGRNVKYRRVLILSGSATFKAPGGYVLA